MTQPLSSAGGYSVGAGNTKLTVIQANGLYTGSVGAVGTLSATGNSNANSNVQLKFNILGSLANPTLQLGNANLSYTPTIDTAIAAAGNYTGTFAGLTIQNRSSSSTSSTNFYLSADNATETDNYVAMGINSSNYDGGQFMDTGPYSTYITSTHGDIVLAPQALRGMGTGNTTGGNVHFAYDYVNDDTYASKGISITNKGALSVDTVANGGNYTFATGASGQVLVSGGANAAISWSNTAPHATTANTVTTAAQPNITSVGTLTTLTLSVSNAAPASPATGTFAVADLTNWDPASKGSGNPYPVFWDGFAWNALY